MKLKLIRHDFRNKNATEGTILIGRKHQCYSIEDKDRYLEDDGVKVQNKTAIPRGIYEVVITRSNRFKRDMPLLLNVPFFTGIRIHTGNTSENTEGCIIVGESNNKRGDNFIESSRVAYNKLFPKIQEAIKRGEKITLEIV